MKDPWKIINSVILGTMLADVIMHASQFGMFYAEIMGGFGMRKYIVIVWINDEERVEYDIYANSAQSASFLAGMKFMREEGIQHAGTKVTCSAAIPSARA